MLTLAWTDRRRFTEGSEKMGVNLDYMQQGKHVSVLAHTRTTTPDANKCSHFLMNVNVVNLLGVQC